MKNLKKLGLNETILKTLEKLGFTEPTEVQEKTIPSVLQGIDVIAGSATGSGKTLVFGAGIIHNCKAMKKIQALVMVPTRELAEQVSKTIGTFSKQGLKIEAVYGGVAIGPQIRKLQHADVVVGTPGRILDHMQRNTIDISHVKILVLDEADRMLDMGFIYDVEKIIRHCPEKRQTMMFSATISEDIRRLSKNYMKNPVKVLVESYIDQSKLTQSYYNVSDIEKFSLLVHLLKNEDSKLVMVFCNTKRNTDFVANNLKELGINALAIHGGFSQEQRSHVMEKFHSQNISVLVCTDVAARGLDIKEVSHVYNYDIPSDSKAYIHRIGRTARAGKKGKAVSILAPRDYDNFREVLKDRKLEIERLPVPVINRVYVRWIEKRRTYGGGRGGRSGSSRGGRGYGRESSGSRDYSSAPRRSWKRRN
ncbi:MAG: DEAD/DEAH box helicase [Candidatus Aenigmatarchaeota archaeon]